MPEPDVVPTTPATALVRREWTTFRSRRRMLAVTAAWLSIVLVGLLIGILNRTSCSEGPIEVACPTEPVTPDGLAVQDQFSFVHRPLGENGTITVRMTSLSGIITYPPPDHDEIVPGLVPWAKAGIIVKDGLEQGSAYAALMVTGSHGVRMQYDYTRDIAGSPGGVSVGAPRWLRLTRAGDAVTGAESSDGAHWTEVGTAHLPGLPRTVRVGLFAASPGDLTLRPVALGGSLAQSRFTQATAVFDAIGLDGRPAPEGWTVDSLGESGVTDWERFHRPPGLVESNGAFTVTGSGDIAPAGRGGGHTVEEVLVGLAVGMIILLVVAVRFGAARPPAMSGPHGSGVPAGPSGAAGPLRGGRVLAARALVVGAVAFLTGLAGAGVALPAGVAVLRATGNSVLAVPTLVELRVVVGVGVLLAGTAVLGVALGALVRPTGAAALAAIATTVLPHVLGVLPLLPDSVADWLLRVTPAAGFATTQTLQEYPQVLAHYAPSAGYFPLPWWAGLAVLGAYAAGALGLAVLRSTTRTR